MKRLLPLLLACLITGCTDTEHFTADVTYCGDESASAIFADEGSAVTLTDAEDVVVDLAETAFQVSNSVTVEGETFTHTTDLTWQEEGTTYVFSLSCLTDECFSLTGGNLSEVDVDIEDAEDIEDADSTYRLNILFSNAADAVRRLEVTLHFQTLTTTYDYDEVDCDFECVSKESYIPIPTDCSPHDVTVSCTYTCANGQEGNSKYETTGCFLDETHDYAPIDVECTLLEIIPPTVPEAFEMTINESEE